ncbi:MAG: hypothetical protein J0H85_13690 [Sediminibacterium magnilacihabitans]|jgi:hypothetical protein|nr:hypothetical protein [Sediminibacterium magnilacihabitans]PQV59481.1 hypothetical protein CLV53_11842 [Sediminibacterium magnilacihabitans]
MATQSRKRKIEHPCRWCGKEIPEWRSNKKFCDEEHKNKFFNELRKQETLELGRVNKKLKRNYEILKKVIKDEVRVKIKAEALERKGFDFHFMTHIFGDYHNCYNLAWRTIEYGYVMITRTPESTLVERD